MDNEEVFKVLSETDDIIMYDFEIGSKIIF